jgi:hypothetical protein
LTGGCSGSVSPTRTWAKTRCTFAPALAELVATEGTSQVFINFSCHQPGWCVQHAWWHGCEQHHPQADWWTSTLQFCTESTSSAPQQPDPCRASAD